MNIKKTESYNLTKENKEEKIVIISKEDNTKWKENKNKDEHIFVLIAENQGIITYSIQSILI